MHRHRHQVFFASSAEYVVWWHKYQINHSIGIERVVCMTKVCYDATSPCRATFLQFFLIFFLVMDILPDTLDDDDLNICRILQ